MRRRVDVKPEDINDVDEVFALGDWGLPHGGLWSRPKGGGELVCRAHDRPVSWHQ